MSDNPSALERRCVDAYARASETTDYGTELNTLGIVRAVLAEAGVAELVESLTRAVAIIEHCDVTEGVCCCGDNMDTHAEPMSCGHSPVDHGSYTASQWLDEARDALTKIGANQ